MMYLDAPPRLTARNSESFKGCNDLHIATNGETGTVPVADIGILNSSLRGA